MPRLKSVERERILSDSRQRLLTAAAGEFARMGYEAANINQISLKAGFAKGTVYNYFSSKAQVMSELVDLIAEKHCEFVTRQVRLESDPRRRLEAFYQAGFAFAAENPALASVMVTTLHGPVSELKAHIYRACLPLFRLLSQDILEPGIELELFCPVDREATVLLLMTLYFGSLAQTDQVGKSWLDHRHVSNFALSALRQV
jgi:AcrR family transcriptional regulator